MLEKNREAPMKALATSLVVSAALCFASVPSSAMPVANLAPVTNYFALHQSVVWVCGPFRCWWRPWGYYRPWAYYRPVYPAYGYYRPYGFYGYGPPGGVYGGQGGYGYGPQGGGYGGQGNMTKEPLSTGK
jgi:hypothetical protein